MNVKLDTHAVLSEMSKQGLTGVALSEKTGISRQSISTIIRRGTCNIVTCGKLAAALGIPVDIIMKDV